MHRAFVAGGALILFSGCSQPETVPTPVLSSWAQQLVQIRDDAASHGASEDQLKDIDDAIASASVSFEVARTAVERAVECMVESGIAAEVTVQTTNGGYDIPVYVATSPTESDAERDQVVIDTCDHREQYYTSMAYQLQPAADESRNALIDERLPALIACLEHHGRDLDPNASRDELVRAALDYLTEQLEAGANPPVNCLQEAGIDGA